jgi:Leucine rich repeat
MAWNSSAFSRVPVIAEHNSGVADMSERPSRRNTRTPGISAAVSERIDQAQRDRASELDLSGQGLTALPEALGRLTQLQSLNLADNQLTALPEFIRHLRALEALFLHGNEALVHFHRSLCALRSPMVCLDDETTCRCPNLDRG